LGITTDTVGIDYTTSAPPEVQNHSAGAWNASSTVTVRAGAVLQIDRFDLSRHAG
jgi:hypothetical protein